MNRLSGHMTAVLQAILVVFLWATSWVLIKIGLGNIPALTFAGLRYVLAFLVLAMLALKPERLTRIRQLPRSAWVQLGILGLLYYTGAQGTQFIGLALLPAITMNLLLSFSVVVIALLGIVFLREHPHPLQWVGMALYLAGVLVYFTPVSLPASQILGIIVALAGVLTNAVASIMGRQVNRAGDLDPFTITLISMGIGAIVTLIVGVTTQGLPALGWQDWLVVAWLAVVNSAFAFTLWNHTLRTLSAMESGIINNLMMVFVPVLAWLFLNEGLTTRQGIGMLLAGAGILTVQLRRSRAAAGQPAARIEPLPEEIG